MTMGGEIGKNGAQENTADASAEAKSPGNHEVWALKFEILGAPDDQLRCLNHFKSMVIH